MHSVHRQLGSKQIRVLKQGSTQIIVSAGEGQIGEVSPEIRESGRHELLPMPPVIGEKKEKNIHHSTVSSPYFTKSRSINE